MYEWCMRATSPARRPAKVLSASLQLDTASGLVALLANALVAIVAVAAADGIGRNAIQHRTHQELRITLAALHGNTSCVLQITNWERCWQCCACQKAQCHETDTPARTWCSQLLPPPGCIGDNDTKQTCSCQSMRSVGATELGAIAVGLACTCGRPYVLCNRHQGQAFCLAMKGSNWAAAA